MSVLRRLRLSATNENVSEITSPMSSDHRRRRLSGLRKQKNLVFLRCSPTIADEWENVAGQEERLAVIAEQTKQSDVDFMELIRQFPTIYNKRSKDFHDKREKENCWKKVAELLNTTTQEVERWYKTIRTAFTRYLSK